MAWKGLAFRRPLSVCASKKVEAHRVLAGDLGRRTGRSESYPRSSLGVPRHVLTHGAVKLTFRGGQFYGVTPLPENGQNPSNLKRPENLR